jgi:hypothetical protein
MIWNVPKHEAKRPDLSLKLPDIKWSVPFHEMEAPQHEMEVPNLEMEAIARRDGTPSPEPKSSCQRENLPDHGRRVTFLGWRQFK